MKQGNEQEKGCTWILRFDESSEMCNVLQTFRLLFLDASDLYAFLYAFLPMPSRVLTD